MKKFLGMLATSLCVGLIACGDDSSSAGSNPSDALSDQSLQKVYVTDTIYQIKTGSGDVQEWNASYCSVSKDRFSCSDRSNCRDEVFRCEFSADNPDVCVIDTVTRDTIRDTVKVKLNYGDKPVVDYIPYADIPEFNRDSVKALFAELDGAACKVGQKLESNYYLEAIGLPAGFEWYRVEIDKFGGMDRYSDDGLVTAAETNVDSLGAASDVACLFRVMAVDIMPSLHYCDVPTLPESRISETYKLVNTSVKSFADTTIQWKLVYKDQYGRGDTLDMTTHFSKNSGQSAARDTLFVTDTLYRIQDAYGEVSEWLSKDCNVGDSSFSCMATWYCGGSRYEPDASIFYPNSNVTYVYDTVRIDLNFGENPVVDYIPRVEVPEFNADSVKALFAEFSGDRCQILQELSSNYTLEAIGLPDSLEFVENNNTHELTSISSAGGACLVVETITVADVEYMTCESTLPESLLKTRYKLVNSTSKVFPDTTFQWKLAYTDQYGRGDTLEVTTHLTIPE